MMKNAQRRSDARPLAGLVIAVPLCPTVIFIL